jgi:hypothetical protein
MFLRDELGVEVGVLDLDDVDLDLLARRELGDLVGHRLDLGAFAADDDAGAGRCEWSRGGCSRRAR